MHSWQRGVGDFYNYGNNGVDNNDDNEDNHFPCLFLKVLPMQSTTTTTARITTTTLFYDATINLMVRCIPG